MTPVRLEPLYNVRWASSRENLSSGSPTKPVSNQSPQLRNFARSKFRYHTFLKANNNGADQSARMRRLVCAFIVRKHPKTVFLEARPRCIHKVMSDIRPPLPYLNQACLMF